MKSRFSATMLFLSSMFWLFGCASSESTVVVEQFDFDQEGQVDIDALPDTVDVATALEAGGQEGVVMIDVREQWEYDEGHIPGVTLIPMGEVANRLDEIPTDQVVIVTCRSGNRSGQITDYLREQGYDKVHNMEGGILAWEAAGLPVER